MKLLSGLLFCFVAGCAGHFDASNATGFQTIERKDGRYWAYVPSDAAQREQRGELLPVLVYLHDDGARGDEPEDATQEGLGSAIAHTDGKYPLVVLFPQLGRGKSWSAPLELANLSRFVDDALHRVGGDPERVSLTGVGAGANGAWQLAAANPGRFAALVPIGATAKTLDVGTLAVRAFNGKDARRAYGDPSLVEWLLAQKRASANPEGK